MDPSDWEASIVRRVGSGIKGNASLKDNLIDSIGGERVCARAGVIGIREWLPVKYSVDGLGWESAERGSR